MHIENLNTYLLEDLCNPTHPSDFFTAEPYDMLVLRLPEPSQNTLQISSYAFLFHGTEVYIYDRDKKRLNPFEDTQTWINFVDAKIDELIKAIQHYHLNIETLEERLYNGEEKNDFMHEWLQNKKEVSLIHRLMFHASLAFDRFIVRYRHTDNIEEKHGYALNDLAEHMHRIRDLAQAASEKLDNLYDFYRAKVDEKMNKNVYYLTLLSGIFLPLTLITGFFGMNTGGLPWADDPHGTLKSVILATLLEILFFLPFFYLNKRNNYRKK